MALFPFLQERERVRPWQLQRTWWVYLVQLGRQQYHHHADIGPGYATLRVDKSPTLIFLCFFFKFLALFSFARNSLLCRAFFRFFPKDYRALLGKSNPCFSVMFLAAYPKRNFIDKVADFSRTRRKLQIGWGLSPLSMAKKHAKHKDSWGIVGLLAWESNSKFWAQGLAEQIWGECFILGPAICRKIAGEFLCKSRWQIFFAKFSVLFFQGFRPPPKKITPKIHAQRVGISLQCHFLEPNFFTLIFCLLWSQTVSSGIFEMFCAV